MQYHHDIWLGCDLGGNWYPSVGRGRHNQPVRNLAYGTTTHGKPALQYRAVAK